MMEKLHSFHFKIILLLFFLIGGGLFFDTIVKADPKLTLFSYICGLATLLGLTVSFLEILKTKSLSLEIQKESKALLDKIQEMDKASEIADCIATLNEVNNFLTRQKFDFALREFQQFRKTYCKNLQFCNFDHKIPFEIEEVEKYLQSFQYSSPKAPVDHRTNLRITQSILKIKNSIEKITSDRSVLDATK